MKKALLLCISLVGMLSFGTAQAMEKIFYLTQDAFNNTLFSQTVLNTIQAHASAMDILAPQIYSFSANGLMRGKLDPELLSLAKKYHLKILPLVTNENFKQDLLHEFLNNPSAEKRLIDSLLNLCKLYNFYGIQLDIEHVNFLDKDALTQFVQLAADAFHKQGYNLSIAVVPPLESQASLSNAHQQWVFENWSGGYDFYALSKSVDFFSLMAYDYHNSITPPGPIAPFQSVEKSLKAVLADNVPADKISLGIPLYSGYWASVPNIDSDGNFLEPSFYLKREIIDYPTLQRVLASVNKPLLWDEDAQVPYVIFDQQGIYGFLFVENAKAFQAKLALVNQYHLRGFSAWKLSFEDPGIWDVLKK